jgi:CRP-like cAMP-binding protein
MSILNGFVKNGILAALSPESLGRISASLDLVAMDVNDVVYERGEAIRYVYFPVTAIVSLEFVLQDGGSIEVASVGRESMLDFSQYISGGAAFARATVRVGGQGYRIDASLLSAECARSAGSLRIFLRNTVALAAQVSLAIVCNRSHSVEQQVCRWLLLALDRIPGDSLVISSDSMARIIGAQSMAVLKITDALQLGGHVVCRDGNIHVLNRSGLEARTCECYDMVSREFGRLYADLYEPA